MARIRITPFSSGTGRYCRTSHRIRTVELEIETNESKHGLLNQDCGYALDLESMLLAHSDKIPFSTVSVRLGPQPMFATRPLQPRKRTDSVLSRRLRHDRFAPASGHAELAS